MEFDKKGRIINNFEKQETMSWSQLRRYRLQHQFDDYQKESLKTATRHKEKWTKEEMKQWLDNDVDMFNATRILQAAKLHKRTWWAMRIPLEVRDYYLENGVIRMRYIQRDKNGEEKIMWAKELIKEILDENDN